MLTSSTTGRSHCRLCFEPDLTACSILRWCWRRILYLNYIVSMRQPGHTYCGRMAILGSGGWSLRATGTVPTAQRKIGDALYGKGGFHGFSHQKCLAVHNTDWAMSGTIYGAINAGDVLICDCSINFILGLCKYCFMFLSISIIFRKTRIFVILK